MSINILLADDHRIVREGLKNLLEIESDMEVIGEADNGREAVRLAVKLKPDIIIMDIGMPELNGVDATRQILNQIPEARVIALSMHSEDEFIRRVLVAGASAYLLKDCAADELAVAVRRVHSGRKYLSQDISEIIMRDFVKSKWMDKKSGFTSLTDREREVLQLLAEGKSNKDISEKLFVSVKTIESHRKNIMDKLQLFTIPELTKYAIRNGITTLE